MKKITYTIGFAFAMLATSNAVAQQGFGTNRPDKSAAVEIKSPNKGLLIPRIALTSDTDVTTIANPANSLLIYNETATASLHAGYYYYKASANKWIPFLDSQFQNNTTVTQEGQNLSVVGTPTTNANGSVTTDYKVKITPGTDKQFLATEMVGTELQTKWVDYTTIANLITAENGLTKTGNVIKLGGDLTGATTIDTKAFDLFIKGLSTTTVMTNKVIAVGDATTGKVEVATPQTIIAAGIDNNLTSVVNDMTSVVNGDIATAKIINTNDLSIAGTVLKSAVNGVEDTQDLKQAIQDGQIKYDVTAGTGITVDTAGSTADLKTFKVNADLGNIALAGDVTGPANNNKVVKIQNVPVSATVPAANQVLKEVAGVWTPATLTTTDITDGKKLSSTDLSISTVDNKALLENLTIDINSNAVTAVKLNDDTAGAGLVRNTTTKALDVNATNGIKIDADFVKLGGALTEATTITTTATETLAIAGLADFTGDQKSIVVLGPNNVLQKASLNTSNAIETKTADYTVLAADETILVDATNGNVAITLPAADATNKGKRVYVKLIATNTANTNEVSIDSTSNIDGDASPITSSSPFQAWMLQSNGSAWFVVGN